MREKETASNLFSPSVRATGLPIVFSVSIFTCILSIFMLTTLHWDLSWDNGEGVCTPFKVIPGHPKNAIGFLPAFQLHSKFGILFPLLTLIFPRAFPFLRFARVKPLT